MAKIDNAGVQLSSLPNAIIGTLGATASVLMTTIIIGYLGILPETIVYTIGLFVSLPLIFTFIFGLITNNPDYESAIRRYGFGAYILVALVIFMVIARPEGFLDGLNLFYHFLIGFSIAMFSGLVYVWFYKILRENTYRVKAGVSFLISTLLTAAIIFVLDHYDLFNWLG